MDDPTLGFEILGSITGALLLLAIILRNGQEIHEKKEAAKKEEFHNNFLHVKPSKHITKE
ncbi:MAG: hypothetical protein PHX13_10350 [Thiovulaceae bacterium]|nr:hypothetical protein [Sulfurimonadaceae bacterium]